MTDFRRKRKPLAAVVMACWLFALFVSVAHACGFDASLGNANRGAPMSMSGHSGGDQHAAPACGQFCADDLPVLAKIKLVQDQTSTQPALVSPLTITPLPTGAPPGAPLSRSPRPPAGVSLNIRFARLLL